MTAGGSQMRLFVLAHLEITLRQFFDLLLFLFTEIGQAGIPLCGSRFGRLNTVGLQHRCRRQRRTDGRQWRQCSARVNASSRPGTTPGTDGATVDHPTCLCRETSLLQQLGTDCGIYAQGDWVAT
jgi:hypothetical protein